jgi:hypothetical protein
LKSVGRRRASREERQMNSRRIGAGLDAFNGNSAGETRDLGNGHVMLGYQRYNACRNGVHGD